MLPGKLCIGLLEEDNPVKAYFRVKPIILLNNGIYEVFNENNTLPDEGCLRIVPDKNESGRFKARMRRMGRYCLVDLRNHPAVNEKIRTNKNYGENPEEHNANIVYSDVVREVSEGMLLDIVSDPSDETATTAQVLVNDDNRIYHHVQEASGLRTYLEQDGTLINEEEIIRFEVQGTGGRPIRIAVRKSEEYLPAVRPIVNPQPAEVMPVVAESNEKIAEAIEMPVVEQEPALKTREDQPRETAENVEKVQIATEPAARRNVNVHRALSSRVGLNPRGRMSLQEIIDEKWCRSREDQLGHPIPGGAMGQPLENPVDRAIGAIREAWSNPETRTRLIDEIAGMGNFADDLDRRIRTNSERAYKDSLDSLEAERLKALTQIDQLRRDKKELRETFKAEIRKEEEKALADAVAKTKKAQQRLDELNSQVEMARKDADAVRDVLASLRDGRFEAEIRTFALKNRCMDVIARMSDGDACPPSVPDCEPDREEWMKRIRAAFEKRGLTLTEIEAANYLVCAALADSIVISGPVGSDRQLTIDALAETLGIAASGRIVHIPGGPRRPMPPFIADRLHGESDFAGFEMVSQNDPFDGVTAAGKHPGYIRICEAIDSGRPLSAERLEDSWFVRLAPLPACAPWCSRGGSADVLPSASISALKASYIIEGNLSQKLLEQLAAVRGELGQLGFYLSRKMLADLWQYCVAMRSVCSVSEEEAFDRGFAQRVLPGILASANVDCLKALREILRNMPVSVSLLDQPLPIEI